MKLFLKLSRLSRTIVLILFHFNAIAQVNETGKKIYPKQLLVKASLVVPVYYDFKMYSTDSMGEDHKKLIKPNFRLTFQIGLQYKTKRNTLFDLQIQHYDFKYNSPVSYSRNTNYSSYLGSYYAEDYGLYRVSMGVGRQKEISNKK